MKLELKKMLFKECHLAGRQYYDVNEVWNDLQIGTLLRLERIDNNPKDENAIGVFFDKHTEVDGETELTTYFLGYVPAVDNKEMAKLMDMGWGNIFECSICKINPQAHYENQIYFTIRIRRNEANQ